jgi:predicted  nucleic acid-binding Zn-ribbon protein
MGPTNQALLALFRADSTYRSAQEELDTATRGVRIQRKRAELAEQALAQTVDALKHATAQQMELDSDLKQRDEHIEHLRLQQQESQNHKQYQAFLGEINTQKVERGRVEEESAAKLQLVDSLKAQQQQEAEQAKAEREKAEQLQSDIGDTTARLEAKIAELKPVRDQAATAVPAGLLSSFERLADNYDGEALAAIGHIDGKEERYYCTACNMELVVDVYNRLMTRDDVVACPGCGRLLYVPEELTPEMAVRQKKTKRPSRAKGAKKTGKKTIKRSRKGLPADLKRAITTAAAESTRQAELDGVESIEVEVRVEKVQEAAGPYSVASIDHFRGRIDAMVQAGDIEATYEIVALVAGAEVTPAEQPAAGAHGDPTEDPTDRIPSQPTVEPAGDASPIAVAD